MSSKNPEITLDFLNQLAHDLLFELDEQQCKNLLVEFDAIEEQMSLVRKIDTTNVVPLNFPFEIKKNYLRSDSVEASLAVEDVLSVASQTKDNYIVVSKVTNNEE